MGSRRLRLYFPLIQSFDTKEQSEIVWLSSGRNLIKATLQELHRQEQGVSGDPSNR